VSERLRHLREKDSRSGRQVAYTSWWGVNLTERTWVTVAVDTKRMDNAHFGSSPESKYAIETACDGLKV